LPRLKIVLGVTGSIAAYKSAVLVRGLIKEGHEVKVVMTPSSKDFISPLTLSTLSKNEVSIDVSDGKEWNNHVELGLWADLMIIAPATANTLAKMANGICDNMLLATYLSAKCPVWVAPAMDLDMWNHPTTTSNIQRLNAFDGMTILDVGTGELASGLIGPGRMTEPEEIINAIASFEKKNLTLKGITALVTAGPTHEHIDPVRFLGNPSSGKMGVALANEIHSRGGDVHLVHGPIDIASKKDSISYYPVTNAEEMYECCTAIFPKSDLSIFAAAVADYTPVSVSAQKIKKGKNDLNLELRRTIDIAGTLGHEKSERQVSVGFALETNDEASNAQKKLIAKKFNFIVLNSLNDTGAGFKTNTNKVTIFDDMNRTLEFELKSKRKVASDIIDHYSNYYQQ
jgi:phosphopantothenoylcysteine decarboxylase/phosphopantothenate--cysteine ligase